MPTLIDAGKTPHAGAPQPPGDVGRDVEVGKLLWIRGEARYVRARTGGKLRSSAVAHGHHE
jgi:hypothetical protein